MLQQLSSLAWPSFADRLVLALNHVLSSEPQAVSRLRPHAGRTVLLGLEGLPALLQWPEPLAFRITPAGLLEREAVAPGEQADLRMQVDMGSPVRLLETALTGQRPDVAVEGDAQLAGDIAWLMDNLRWDIEDDLARVVGPAPARQAAVLLRQGGAALRQALGLLLKAVSSARGGDLAGQGRP